MTDTVADESFVQQMLTALKDRTQQALSPWVRRQLQGDSPSNEQAAEREVPMLTARSTESLVGHFQRVVERTRVWRPDIGSLHPASVTRFAETVVQRARAVQPRRVQRLSQEGFDWGDDVELVLPRGSRSSESGATRGPAKIKGPGLLTAGQRIEPMRKPSSSPRQPRPQPRPRPHSRPTPSATVRRPSAGRTSRKPMDPGARLYAQVEEVLPDEQDAGGQGGQGAEEQGSEGAEERGSGGAEEQRSRGAEGQRGRGAEEQRGRGAEGQRSRGAGEQSFSPPARTRPRVESRSVTEPATASQVEEESQPTQRDELGEASAEVAGQPEPPRFSQPQSQPQPQPQPQPTPPSRPSRRGETTAVTEDLTHPQETPVAHDVEVTEVSEGVSPEAPVLNEDAPEMPLASQPSPEVEPVSYEPQEEREAPARSEAYSEAPPESAQTGHEADVKRESEAPAQTDASSEAPSESEEALSAQVGYEGEADPEAPAVEAKPRPETSPPSRPPESQPPPSSTRTTLEAQAPETLSFERIDAAPDVEMQAQMPLRERQERQEVSADVSPEALPEPSSELGAELLNRVGSSDEPLSTVQATSFPENPLAELPVVTDRAWRGVQRPRSAPTLYTRGPDVYVGPDPSATVLKLASVHQEGASRYPEPSASTVGIAASHGPRSMDESPLARLQAIFGGGEAVQQEATQETIAEYLTNVSPEAQWEQQEEMVLSNPSQFPEASSGMPLEASAQRMQEMQQDEEPMPLVEPSTSQPSEEEEQQDAVSASPDDPAPDAVVQHVAPDEDDDAGENTAAEPDLEKLARDIYPIVRRMLTIERERMPGLG